MMTTSTPRKKPTYFNLAKKVKKLVGENKSEQALSLLQQALNGHPDEHIVIIRTAQQNGLKRNNLNGTLSYENANLTQNQINLSLLKITDDLVNESAKNTNIYICYHPTQVSIDLASTIKNTLKEKHFSVFMDTDMSIGTNEQATVSHKIRECDYFIFLLTKTLFENDAVIKELETANELVIENNGPIIIPINIQLSEAVQLPFRLKNILNNIRAYSWENSNQTKDVLSQILDVLYKRVEIINVRQNLDIHPGQPIAPLEIPNGAVGLNSAFYVERPQEAAFIKNIDYSGALLRIRGPRQYGKTSLLTRINGHARKRNYYSVIIDFQKFEESTLSNLDQLLYEFCFVFADKFRRENELDNRWNKPRPRNWSSTAFLERDILPLFNQPILVAIDEADRLFHYPEVSKAFFLLLRSWHEESKISDSEEWKKFRLALTYSTETRLAIQDMNASPFNVGIEAQLDPFSLEQTKDLAARHGLNWTASQYETIEQLLGGQPYLVRRAMYLIANKSYTFSDLIQQAATLDGPFGNHLKHHLTNIKKVEIAATALKEILRNGTCYDPILAAKLEATGLVKRERTVFQPANDLYASFFQGKL